MHHRWPLITFWAGGLAVGMLCLTAGTTLAALSGADPADAWLTNPPPHPSLAAGVRIDVAAFTNLYAEALAGRLKVSWDPGRGEESAGATQFTLHTSTAPLTQWPVRDWRSIPLERSGQVRQADVAAEELDMPIVYYVRASTPQSTRVSPLRVVFPRRLGLEEPTRLFWPFLEGFEQGLESWRLLSDAPELPALRISGESKNGQAALLVSLPATRKSVRIATTRARGWQLVQEGATGLGLWLRMRSGQGHVRCSLQAQSATTNLSIGTWAKPIPVGHKWMKVELPFAELPILPWRSVDLFVLEFQAAPPAELLVDDVQFLGPWKLDPQ